MEVPQKGWREFTAVGSLEGQGCTDKAVNPARGEETVEVRRLEYLGLLALT